MDVLSEVLKAVKLDGAVFFNGEFSTPWCAREPDACTMAAYLSVQSKHVIIFHLVTEGTAYISLEHDARRVPLVSGDLVVLPHGQAHVMGNGPPVTPMETAAQLSRIVSEGLRLYRFGRGGEVTKLICGYMTCDPQLSRMLLAGLPKIIKINIRDEASGRWLEDTLRYSVDHAEASGPGVAAVVAKLSEALFVETSRRFISALPQAQTGWLAGASRTSARPWPSSIGSRLSPGQLPRSRTKWALSRSVLAERFRHYLSETPIGYLTRWRMHLAAQLLTSTSKSVAEVAGDVGYESEPSFNRAFKRAFGIPPARFRSYAKPHRDRSPGAAGVQGRTRVSGMRRPLAAHGERP
jgi:AraC-like DNA-binding protein